MHWRFCQTGVYSSSEHHTAVAERPSIASACASQQQLHYIQGLRSRAAGRRPLRLRKEEWTFSRKAEKKHKWRYWRLENAKRSIYSTTVQDRDDYGYEFVIIIHSPSP